MKILFCRVNRRKRNAVNAFPRNNSRSLRTRMERLLFASFVVAFAALVVIQGMLMNPSVRTFLTADSAFEGSPLGVEEFLYDQGELGLRLSGVEDGQLVKIMVNGEVVGNFAEKEQVLQVTNGDIIEIDGSEVATPVNVEIISASSNVLTQCLNQEFSVHSNVTKLLEVELE